MSGLPVKTKVSSISKSKKKAWGWFSKYIRLRDCLLTTGTKEVGKCFTCDRVYPFEKLQAGHFLAGRGATILFVEDNVHAQCYGCNVAKHGNVEEYYPRMLDLYGQKRIDELKFLKNQTHQWTVDELEKIAETYKEDYEDAVKNN